MKRRALQEDWDDPEEGIPKHFDVFNIVVSPIDPLTKFSEPYSHVPWNFALVNGGPDVSGAHGLFCLNQVQPGKTPPPHEPLMTPPRGTGPCDRTGTHIQWTRIQMKLSFYPRIFDSELFTSAERVRVILFYSSGLGHSPVADSGYRFSLDWKDIILSESSSYPDRSVNRWVNSWSYPNLENRKHYKILKDEIREVPGKPAGNYAPGAVEALSSARIIPIEWDIDLRELGLMNEAASAHEWPKGYGGGDFFLGIISDCNMMYDLDTDVTFSQFVVEFTARLFFRDVN